MFSSAKKTAKMKFSVNLDLKFYNDIEIVRLCSGVSKIVLCADLLNLVVNNSNLISFTTGKNSQTQNHALLHHARRRSIICIRSFNHFNTNFHPHLSSLLIKNGNLFNSIIIAMQIVLYLYALLDSLDHSIIFLFSGIPIAQQHLIWKNIELEDDFYLHDYG